MSQLNPEHEGYTRRFFFACILGFVSVLLAGVAILLRDGGFNVPSWLWLLPCIGAFALLDVAIVLCVTVARELRRFVL